MLVSCIKFLIKVRVESLIRDSSLRQLHQVYKINQAMVVLTLREQKEMREGYKII